MDNVDFGAYFKEQRLASGFKSQRQLAIESGISNGTIARIEEGMQKASPETLKTLSRYIKTISYIDLMDKAGYMDGAEEKDNVKQPQHYTAGGIETIDYIKAKMTSEMWRGYCLGNVLKYTSRYRLKAGSEDLFKAKMYLDWLIEGVTEYERSAFSPEQAYPE